MRFPIPFFLTVASAFPQGAVVPSEVQDGDANSGALIAGFNLDSREQILIDEARLRPSVINQTIRGLSFRRDAARSRLNRGGEADLTITLSLAPHPSREASEEFAANLGPQRVQVFQGRVQLPNSPPPSGSVGWNDPQHVINISFTTAFTYSGGTLVIDIVGQPVAGNASPFWGVDGIAESIEGTVNVVGEACGQHGARLWPTSPYTSAGVGPRELVPGYSATFSAYGEPNRSGAFLLGFTPASIDLFALGVGGPNCKLYILDAVALLTIFEDWRPFGLGAGVAHIPVQIPVRDSLLGAAFRVQFVEIATPIYTSNALDCAFAGSMPSLGMSTVTANFHGGPIKTRGRVRTTSAPVIRFNF